MRDVAGMDDERRLGRLAFTLATASRSVASASGFAFLSKPMWAVAHLQEREAGGLPAMASPSSPTECGTPPLTVQSTPVPAQTMHSSACGGQSLFLIIVKAHFWPCQYSLGAKHYRMTPNCANQGKRLHRPGLYSPMVYNFSKRQP